MESMDQFKDSNGEISRENIKKIIPYGDPFLMIDKVISINKKRKKRKIEPDEETLQQLKSLGYIN